MCLGKSESTDIEKSHLNRNLYFNHTNDILDITKRLMDELVDVQKTDPYKSSKEDLEYCVTAGLDKINID